MKKILFLISLIAILLTGCNQSSIEKNALQRLNFIITEEWPRHNGGNLETKDIHVVYHHPNDSLVIIKFDGYPKGYPENAETLRYIYYIYEDGPYEAISEKEIENKETFKQFVGDSSSKEESEQFFNSIIKSATSLIIADRGRKVE